MRLLRSQGFVHRQVPARLNNTDIIIQQSMVEWKARASKGQAINNAAGIDKT